MTMKSHFVDPAKLDLSWIRGKTPNWSNTIAEVELIAAEIMLKEEKSWDQNKENLDWMVNFIRNAGDGPHSGGCSICRSWLTAPMTCDACVYDKYMIKAWAKKRDAIKAAQRMHTHGQQPPSSQLPSK